MALRATHVAHGVHFIYQGQGLFMALCSLALVHGHVFMAHDNGQSWAPFWAAFGLPFWAAFGCRVWFCPWSRLAPLGGTPSVIPSHVSE
jgi:hypothetical protein